MASSVCQKFSLDCHDGAFKDGMRNNSWCDPFGTSDTNVKMNETLNASKLTPLLNCIPLNVNVD